MSIDVSRRTQAERRAATQAKLLDAALESLRTHGYAGTTVVDVQQRAGVSRGALQHYWPSKAELVVAAVDRLFDEIINNNVREVTRELPLGDRIDIGVEELWASFQTPLFAVSLDLWSSARTDADLRAVLIPHERRLGEEIRKLCREVFREVASHPRFTSLCDAILQSMRGAAMTQGLHPKNKHHQVLLTEWKAIMRDGLTPSEPQTEKS